MIDLTVLYGVLRGVAMGKGISHETRFNEWEAEKRSPTTGNTAMPGV